MTREGATLRRGRLNQGTVLPNRTRSERESYADSMASIRRFGGFKGFEGRIEKILGPKVLEAVLQSSLGVHAYAPVFGLPAWVRDGALVPRIQGGGFSSLSDLINEATVGGKMQKFRVTKTGVTATAATASQHLWGVGTLPAIGANAGNAPGGTIPTNASTGAIGQTDPAGGDTLHFVSAMPLSTSPGALLMYDYLFGVNIPETATSTAVTGVPTRYTGTDSAGNWISARVTTVHTATAGNYSIAYRDEANNTSETTAAFAKRVSSAVQQIPFTQPLWNVPLNSPDRGLREIDTVLLSAGGASGATDWIIGRSLVTMPCPIGSVIIPVDGVNSAFNLVEVKSGAALALMEFFKTATTASTIAIEDLILVSG